MITRVRGLDLVWIDRVGAVLLTSGAIADASSEPHRQLGVGAIVALVALTSSVAWRRAQPIMASLVAISGLIGFEVVSRYNGDGSFEVAALALGFYTIGRCVRDRWLVATVAAYWLGGSAVVTFVPASGTVGGAGRVGVRRPVAVRGRPFACAVRRSGARARGWDGSTA